MDYDHHLVSLSSPRPPAPPGAPRAPGQPRPPAADGHAALDAGEAGGLSGSAPWFLTGPTKTDQGRGSKRARFTYFHLKWHVLIG